MQYVTLSPEAVRKAIEGYASVLEGEAKKLDAFYRQFSCQRCGGRFHKEISSRHAFAPESDTPIARALLRCAACRSLYDPFSGLYVEMGNPARVPSDTRIIKTNSG